MTLIHQPSEFARLICSAASRVTFMMSLDWESQSDAFNPQIENEHLILRERFRVGDSHDAWLEFEAKAPNTWEQTCPILKSL